MQTGTVVSRGDVSLEGKFWISIFVPKAMRVIQVSVILFENKGCYSTKTPMFNISAISKFVTNSCLCKEVHNHRTELKVKQPHSSVFSSHSK